MGYLFADLLKALIGWLYVWIRFRDKEKVKEFLEEECDGSYTFAGQILFFQTFGITMIILVGLLMLVAIFWAIKNLITGQPIP